MDSRAKGLRWEREIISQLREIGYHDAVSTRSSSRYKDSLKIDVDNVPFIIQIKSGKRHVKYLSLLKEIRKGVNEKLKKEAHKPIMIIRVFDVGKGRRRGFKDILVFMLEEEFEKIFEPEDFKLIEIKNYERVNYRKYINSVDDVIKRELGEDTIMVLSWEKFKKYVKNGDNSEKQTN